MRRERSRTFMKAVSLGPALFVLALPAAANAFCRTTTVKTPADYDPSALGHCWSEGLPLYWLSTCISYDVQQDGGPGISYGEATAALATAFALWTGATCGSGGPVSIHTSDLGKVACDRVEYNECGPNQHVIVFRDRWPYDDTVNDLALTTVTYDLGTGELYDADMEINGSVPLSQTTPVPQGSYDFASIVTHEAGHFLGLAHAIKATPIMYAHLSPGAERRELTADDTLGLCTIYPPNGARAVATDAGSGFVDASMCDPSPRHGFTAACMPKPVDGGEACEPLSSGSGCSTSRGRPSSPGQWVPGAWVIGLVLRRRTLAPGRMQPRR